MPPVLLPTALRRLALLCATLGPALCSAQSVPVPARTGVAAVVSGILGYSRWPAELPLVRLCTVGGGAAVQELQRSPSLGPPQRPVTVQALSKLSQAGSDCDAVYVGGRETGLQRETLRSVAGRPVLTLGEGPDFCSDGGMFCIDGVDAVARFGANLDAIARSGLRVNPMVLRIARGAGTP